MIGIDKTIFIVLYLPLPPASQEAADAWTMRDVVTTMAHQNTSGECGDGLVVRRPIRAGAIEQGLSREPLFLATSSAATTALRGLPVDETAVPPSNPFRRRCSVQRRSVSS